MRKVYLRQVHQRSNPVGIVNTQDDAHDQAALETLASLWGGEEEEEAEVRYQYCWKREGSLQIKSTRMPTIHKNRWPGFFLDLVQEDLSHLN